MSKVGVRMKKGFGKPEVEFKSEDYHLNLELENKEQCDFVIERIKEVRKKLPKLK